jgi:GNAT superfamily N-acetyltransferase
MASMLEQAKDKDCDTTGIVLRAFSPSGRLNAWALMINNHDNEALELHVYVRAAERRKGVGSELVKEAIASTRKEILLEASDKASYELYKKVVYSHQRVFFGDASSPYSYPEIREREIYKAVETAYCSVLEGADKADVELQDINLLGREMVLSAIEELQEDYSFAYRAKKNHQGYQFTVLNQTQLSGTL